MMRCRGGGGILPMTAVRSSVGGTHSMCGYTYRRDFHYSYRSKDGGSQIEEKKKKESGLALAPLRLWNLSSHQ